MKKLVWFISIVGAGFIGFAVWPTSKRDVPKEIISLPSVNLLLTDSQTVINTASATKNKAVIVFYFDPSCDHCQKETEDILANKDIFKNMNFYFISLDSMRRIRSFVDHYKLKEFPEITVVKDHEFKALSIFQIKSIPTNVVYNRKHELVKIFIGGVKVGDLKKIING